MLLLTTSLSNQSHIQSFRFVSMPQGLNIFLWGSRSIHFRNRRYSN
jgi:hypothetical protein